MAIVGFLCYFLVVYPITLFCSSDTTALSQNGDRKFTVFNIELIFHVYKVIMVATGVFSQTAMVAVAPVFFFIYILVIVKRPYFCFEGQRFTRSLLSAVAFICFSRGCNAIFDEP